MENIKQYFSTIHAQGRLINAIGWTFDVGYTYCACTIGCHVAIGGYKNLKANPEIKRLARYLMKKEEVPHPDAKLPLNTRIKHVVAAAANVGQCVAGVVLAASAVLLFGQRCYRWLTLPTTLHPYERQVGIQLGSEALEIDPNDTRPKAVVMTANEDWNGALFPLFKSMGHLKAIDRKYDLYYVAVDSPKAICQVLTDTAQKGPIDLVVYRVHGTPEGMYLNDQSSFNVRTGQDFYRDQCALTEKVNYCSRDIFPFSKTDEAQAIIPDCFKGLSPKARQVTSGCSTGAAEDGIAYHLALISGHPVTAPVIAPSHLTLRWNPENPQEEGFVDAFPSFHPSITPLPTLDNYARTFYPSGKIEDHGRPSYVLFEMFRNPLNLLTYTIMPSTIPGWAFFASTLCGTVRFFVDILSKKENEKKPLQT